MRVVTLFHAPGCHLCELARDVLGEVGRDVPFTLREVDISGDEQLEREHRVYLPVVEIEGGERFVFDLDPDDFRRALNAQSSPSGRGL